jgi:hypothetical protein
MYASAQELYVHTEPASNMPANSIGLRLSNSYMPMSHNKKTATRFEPEIMWGVNKKLMLHTATYFSNMFQANIKFEGAGLYAKYRFLSVDDVHAHFRMAAFAKLTAISNPVAEIGTITHKRVDSLGNPYLQTLAHTYKNNELVVDGNHSGYQAGIIATQLVHKLALSTSVFWVHRLNNLNKANFAPSDPRSAINYTLSGGYLLYPKSYTSYGQTNINLYFEILGSKLTQQKGYFIDAAPAIQFIFNSIARLDLSYRFNLANTLVRMNNQTFLIKFEYNLLNVFSKKD